MYITILHVGNHQLYECIVDVYVCFSEPTFSADYDVHLL